MSTNANALPDTDSPEVMQQAIAMWLTGLVWEQTSRLIPDEKVEAELTSIYHRVYQLVSQAHKG